MPIAPYDTVALLDTIHRDKKRFAKLVKDFRKQGITDAEMVKAMATNPLLVREKEKKRRTKRRTKKQKPRAVDLKLQQKYEQAMAEKRIAQQSGGAR